VEGVVLGQPLRVTRKCGLIGGVEPGSFLAIARDLEAIARSAEFVKVWWLPGTSSAQIFRYLRTPLPATDVTRERFLDTHVVNRWVFPAVLELGRRMPHWTPAINRVVAASYLERPAVPMRSDLAFNVAMPPIHRETEYSFPMDRAGEALSRIAELITRERLAVNFPVEVRFVREDSAWMSPAYGRPTCQIGGYMSDSTDLPRFFSAFEALSLAMDARPHWGKENNATAEHVRRVYPRRDDFVALARAWDPDGTLRNAFLDHVLGP